MLFGFDNAINLIKKEAEESGRSELDVMSEAINVGISYIKARRETVSQNIKSAAITVEEISFMTNLFIDSAAVAKDAEE